MIAKTIALTGATGATMSHVLAYIHMLAKGMNKFPYNFTVSTAIECVPIVPFCSCLTFSLVCVLYGMHAYSIALPTRVLTRCVRIVSVCVAFGSVFAIKHFGYVPCEKTGKMKQPLARTHFSLALLGFAASLVTLGTFYNCLNMRVIFDAYSTCFVALLWLGLAWKETVGGSDQHRTVGHIFALSENMCLAATYAAFFIVGTKL